MTPNVPPCCVFIFIVTCDDHRRLDFQWAGYAPCPLCLQQRWAYYAAIPLAFSSPLVRAAIRCRPLGLCARRSHPHRQQHLRHLSCGRRMGFLAGTRHLRGRRGRGPARPEQWPVMGCDEAAIRILGTVACRLERGDFFAPCWRPSRLKGRLDHRPPEADVSSSPTKLGEAAAKRPSKSVGKWQGRQSLSMQLRGSLRSHLSMLEANF